MLSEFQKLLVTQLQSKQVQSTKPLDRIGVQPMFRHHLCGLQMSLVHAIDGEVNWV